MAKLPDQDRFEIWAEFMRAGCGGPCTVLKTDLRAAVDALDAWLDANMTSANAALPVAARGGLTAAQKAMLLVYVVQRRWLKGV